MSTTFLSTNAIGSNINTMLYNSLIPLLYEDDNNLWINGSVYNKNTLLKDIALYTPTILNTNDTYYLNTLFTQSRIWSVAYGQTNGSYIGFSSLRNMPYYNYSNSNIINFLDGSKWVLSMGSYYNSHAYITIYDSYGNVTNSFVLNVAAVPYSVMIKINETTILISGGTTGTAYNSGYYNTVFAYLTKNSNGTISQATNITLSTSGRIHTILGPNSSGKCLVIWEYYSSYNGSTNLCIGTILPTGYTSQITQLISTDISISEIALSPDNTKLYCYSPRDKGFYFATLDLINMTSSALTLITPDISLISSLTAFAFPTSDRAYSNDVRMIYNLQYITNSYGTYLLLSNGISSQSIGIAINGGYVNYRVAIIKIYSDSILQVSDYEQLGGTSTDYTSMYFVVNKGNVLGIRNGGLDMYGINSSNKLVINNSVNEPIYSVGVDDCERVWYVTSATALATDSTLKIFNYNNMYNVNIIYSQTNVSYSTADMNDSISVNCMDLNNNRIAIGLTLFIKGNAIFTSTNTKTMTITTSATSDIVANIIIQGPGVINIIGSLT